MLEKIFETILKDFSTIQSLDNPKTIRKECNMLRSRIKSARRLIKDDSSLEKQLSSMEDQIDSLSKLKTP